MTVIAFVFIKNSAKNTQDGILDEEQHNYKVKDTSVIWPWKKAEIKNNFFKKFRAIKVFKCSISHFFITNSESGYDSFNLSRNECKMTDSRNLSNVWGTSESFNLKKKMASIWYMGRRSVPYFKFLFDKSY